MNNNLKNMLKKRLSALLLTGAVMAGSCQMALAAENAGTSGFENGNGALDLDQIARYSSGMTNEEGGVMVYELTSGGNAKYVNYMNSRDFSADVAADDSPEGLKFIPAKASPTGSPLLLAACEVGGTVAVYEMTR